MSFLDHIHDCNRHDLSNFVPFRVTGVTVGWIRPAFAQALRPWTGVFSVTESAVELLPDLNSFEQRTEAVARVLLGLVERGILPHLHGEQYVATRCSREQGLLLIDRAAAPYFGIRAFGQHLNGFVYEGKQLKLWVARRSADRRNYPGKLDNLVAGGLPYGLSLHDNLIKECHEEAGLPAAIAAQAQPVGILSYKAETVQGFKPDTLYCYDLELPADFVPCCTDGEVEDFYLWPIERVMATVRDSGDFKLNCNLVVMDFLIRHGYIGPEDEDYLELIHGLHPGRGAPSLVAGAAPASTTQNSVLDSYNN